MKASELREALEQFYQRKIVLAYAVKGKFLVIHFSKEAENYQEIVTEMKRYGSL